MKRLTVLSTKKLSSSIINEAAKEDIEIIEQEAIQIKRIWSDEKRKEIIKHTDGEYVVFTSANAVTIVHDYLLASEIIDPLPWKIYSISGKTKEVILDQKLFLKNSFGEATNASALAQKIIEHGVKEIIFFCGNKRREELPLMLKEAGISVHEVMVYETIETPAVAPDNIDAVLFFSPSAVHSFFSVNQPKQNIICFAIGQTTADSLQKFSTNKIIISTAPTQQNMLQAVTLYFKNNIVSDH